MGEFVKIVGLVLNLSMGVLTLVIIERAQAIEPELGGMFLGIGGLSKLC